MVRGCEDQIQNYKNYKWITKIFHEVMALYDVRMIEPAMLEHAKLFTDTAGQTSDIVNKELFFVTHIKKFKEHNPVDLVLRPEGTIPIIRTLLEHGMITQKLLKVGYTGPMFRYNRPQKSRLRQLHQLGCEVFNGTIFDIVEIILSIYRFLHRLGLQKTTLRIYTLGSDLSIYKQKVYDYFCTKRKYLSELQQTRLETNVMRVIDQLTEKEKQDLHDMPQILDYLPTVDVERFQNICTLLDKFAIPYTIDPYLVRGLDYYTHTVFELQHNEYTIGGGGEYTSLVHRIGSIMNCSISDINGCGFGLGLERIALTMAEETFPKQAQVDIAVIGMNEYALQVAEIIRTKHKVMTIIEPKIKKAFRRANIAKCIIIAYEAEQSQQIVGIKRDTERFDCPLTDILNTI